MRFTSFLSTALVAQTLLLLSITAAPLPQSTLSRSPASSSSPAQAQNATTNALDLEARGGTHHGSATWYGQQSRGACGQWHKNSDMIVAISGSAFKMSMCGRTVAVTSRGKTIYAQVADECPGCPRGSLDISRGMFGRWASLDVGVLPISWHFV
ncbi:unnamed protein product [Tilletia controversa]|uniref:RlpA-like protein double-psi beta-barrel domain-containing protein n=3 Tax=Tilletia TaxID=13289 RepID=A0A8X7MUY9_9BASI|nr:hypothetical protein CF336_g2749 [Tilletia laevis]KAE8201801.1 hypothetical protein CF328_g2572 [Tilletia controversa]KAE8262813.1 hypothetical protein A4X03_0g2158 [Tilletia caries]KAE8203710.1 hypothetical protein CF335_g2917 [Tilletia laevis]KAE8249427.1 hypothetical protein A4X06_0g3234 [Tilletia controversa]